MLSTLDSEKKKLFLFKIGKGHPRFNPSFSCLPSALGTRKEPLLLFFVSLVEPTQTSCFLARSRNLKSARANVSLTHQCQRNLPLLAHLFYGIRNLVGNGIPAPFGKPDVRRMRKSKTPKRIFFISLSRPNGDATKEKSALQLISKTFRCSRVAIASVPGKHTDVSYFYVLIELNPGLLWINAKAILENTIPNEIQFVLEMCNNVSRTLQSASAGSNHR